MTKPSNYDEVQAFTGEIEQLPAGAYICEIVKAQEETARSGAKMLVLTLDIAEGEYKGYFRRKYEALLKNNTNAAWFNGGKYRQLMEGNSTAFFKGLIANIENSNKPYKVTFGEGSERTMTGKKICGVFGNEQYKANDGTLKWSAKCAYLTDISMIDNAKIPEDKYLATAAGSGTANAAPVYTTPYIQELAPKFEEINTDDDLPF